MAIPRRATGWPLWSILLGVLLLVSMCAGLLYLGKGFSPLRLVLGLLGRGHREEKTLDVMPATTFIPERNGTIGVSLPYDADAAREREAMLKFMRDQAAFNEKIMQRFEELRQEKKEKPAASPRAKDKPAPLRLKVNAPDTLTWLAVNANPPPAHTTGLHAGTVIHCTTKNRVNTERQRTLFATVTQHVRDSRDPNIVLVPQWSELIMDTDPQAVIAGDARYPAALQRVQLPNGQIIDLPRLPLHDGIGQGGLTGDIDNKLGWLIKGALFRGALAASVAMVREVSPAAIDAAIQPGAQIGQRVTQPYLNVRPTIVTDESTACAIILETPVSLPPYQVAEVHP